jgi:hypothetical protein
MSSYTRIVRILGKFFRLRKNSSRAYGMGLLTTSNVAATLLFDLGVVSGGDAIRVCCNTSFS